VGGLKGELHFSIILGTDRTGHDAASVPLSLKESSTSIYTGVILS
jgi:hypothetical protein